MNEENNNQTHPSVEFDGHLNIEEGMTPEMIEQVELINDIINTEIIDGTTALNILINVAQSVYNTELLNDLDRTLISKAFDSIQHSIDIGEDFYIKLDTTEPITDKDYTDENFPSD